jgi:hypothetical protein
LSRHTPAINLLISVPVLNSSQQLNTGGPCVLGTVPNALVISNG